MTLTIPPTKLAECLSVILTWDGCLSSIILNVSM